MITERVVRSVTAERVVQRLTAERVVRHVFLTRGDRTLISPRGNGVDTLGATTECIMSPTGTRGGGCGEVTEAALDAGRDRVLSKIAKSMSSERTLRDRNGYVIPGSHELSNA